MSSGGGSGGSGTQKYEWNDSLAPFWSQALEYGKALKDAPMQTYGGQRIADLNQDQQNSINNTRQFLYQLQNPSGAINSSINETQKTLDGGYLSGAGADPYANAGNVYEGNSPYFHDALQNGMQDITNSYMNGTKADTDKAFTMSGTYGGSAHQNVMANNQAALGKTLGNYVNQQYNQQYDRSAGLEESKLARGSGAYQNERGRMTGMVGQGGNLQNQALQRAQSEMGIGDIQRGISQDYLNQGYADWQAGQNYPYKQLDMFSGLLSRAQGGMSPNMTTTSPGYSASPYSQLLGGLAAYSALK
jgi:hypothetical protein